MKKKKKTIQKFTNVQIMESMRLHEVQSALRLERINEKFDEIDKKITSIESKIWIIAALIVGTAITNMMVA